eukprot:Gb_41418 [translate_table: standard]
MDVKFMWSLGVTLGGLALSFAVVRVVVKIWWRPLQIKKYFESQGIGGPSYKLLYGNTKESVEMINQSRSTPMDLSHDIVPHLLPHYHAWTKAYGAIPFPSCIIIVIFVFWFGPVPRLVIPDPELIKELLSNKFGHYQKPLPTVHSKQLTGDGLVDTEGEKWVAQRRHLSPAFHSETLKSMLPIVVASAASMLDKWRNKVVAGPEEIEVCNDFRSLTADIIARTAFGSNFVEGRNIFDMQAEQAKLAAESFRKYNVPGFRFLPTKTNLRGKKLDANIQRSLKQLIMERERSVKTGKVEDYGTDLLGLMMAANKNEAMNGDNKHLCMSVQDIVDNCKTFYFAGHETTSLLLTWTVVLLGMHTEWQERARNEVLDVCKKDYPNAEILGRLKIVHMILQEAMRLYPPAVVLMRQTYKEMKLGNLLLPAGIDIALPIILVHHDPELWGKDVKEFNPQRFSEGSSKAAKHPMAFMPFGLGPRICIGQNFAMIEAKVVLAMILQRFSFVLSPTYAHAPEPIITLRPRYGAQIILNQLSLE